MSQKENKQSSNEQDNEKRKNSHSSEEEHTNTSTGNDASTSRSGTTDIENTISTGKRTTESGAGISTKRNVTGSDLDGQTSQ